MVMGCSKSLAIILWVTAGIVCLNYYILTKRPERSPYQKCHEVHQVAFIKGHKVGGTSVQNVIQRFGENNELLAAIPRIRWILDDDFHNIASLPENLHFSIFYSQTQHFDRTKLDQILPSDTLYFTIVREPFSQLVSSFYYHKYKWRTSYLNTIIDNTNPLLEYLREPDKYDPVDIRECFTNNRMSYDLGLPKEHFNDRDAIKEWLRKLDSDLDTILLMEQFDQSMVLLKRKLCWELKDVLYVTKNRSPWKIPHTHVTNEDIKLYNNRYLADVMLYNYSVQRFHRSVAEQTADFQDEVDVFQKILKEFTRYCQIVCKSDIFPLSNLTIAQTKFSSEFQIMPWHCEIMMLSEKDFLRRTRSKQTDLMVMKSLMKKDRPILSHAQWSKHSPDRWREGWIDEWMDERAGE